MADLDLDPQFVQRWLRSEECDEALRARMNVGADFWRTHARKRTGYMAEAVHTAIIDGANGHEGVLEMSAPYARYQEMGFRHHGYEPRTYVEGMHLMQDILALMAEEPS